MNRHMKAKKKFRTYPDHRRFPSPIPTRLYDEIVPRNQTNLWREIEQKKFYRFLSMISDVWKGVKSQWKSKWKISSVFAYFFWALLEEEEQKSVPFFPPGLRWPLPIEWQNSSVPSLSSLYRPISVFWGYVEDYVWADMFFIFLERNGIVFLS